MKNLIRVSTAFGLLLMLCSIVMPQSKSPITKEDLVGKYSMGHRFFNTDLFLAKDGTFEVYWRGCTISGAYNGTYALDEKTLTLTWNSSTEKATTNSGDSIEEKARETKVENKVQTEKLNVVRWDTLIYLLPDNEFLFFCNLVNAGIEPRVPQNFLDGDGFSYDRHYNNRFYLKDEHQAVIPNGLPDVPIEFKQYLLTKPIIGKIIKVETTSDATFANIMVSNKSKLKVGMTFVARPEEFGSGALEVISIQSSSVRVKAYSKVITGNKISTRFTYADKFLQTANK